MPSKTPTSFEPTVRAGIDRVHALALFPRLARVP